MTDEEFRTTISAYGKQVEEKKPTKVLVNVTDFRFVVAPKTQEWVDEKINAIGINIGIKAVAMLMPKELIAELSVEQTMDEKIGRALPIKNFSDRRSAINWLVD